MQYTIGLFGVGVKFEKEEFHRHLKNGWNKVVEVKKVVKEKSKPALLDAADVTLKHTVNVARKGIEVCCDGVDKVQGLRDTIKLSRALDQIRELDDAIEASKR